MPASPEPPASVPPYELTRRTERVGDRDYPLWALTDFEASVGTVYRHWDGAGGRRAREDLCPMFGVIWGAARALAAELHRRGPTLAGQRVLELGCGLALPSLVAASHGADVLATDQHPHTWWLLQRNLALNGLSTVRYATIDWREPPPEALRGAGQDLVLASDVLFSRELPDIVARTFAAWLTPTGTGLLADPGRAYLQEFVHAALAHGLTVHDQVVPAGEQEVFLLTLRRA